MKLSEILSKSFKLKGGGTVNLKGLSKHIVDKEIGGSNQDEAINFISKFFTNSNAIPNLSVVYDGKNLNNLDEITYSTDIYFLYKKEDIENNIINGPVIILYSPQNNYLEVVQPNHFEIRDTIEIDGQLYVRLMPKTI